MKTLEEIKQEIAHEYGSNDYRKDFEYGIGLNKFMDEWEFMDKVAKRYAQSSCEDLRERIAEGAKVKCDKILKYPDSRLRQTKNVYVVDKEAIRNTEIILT